MKILDQIITANSNLFRNKTRTFLTILAVFIGSFTIILSNAVNSGVNNFIDQQIESIGGDDFVMIFPSAMADQVQSGVSKSTGVSEYNPKGGNLLTANITPEDIANLQAVDGVELVELFHVLSPEWITSQKTDKKYQVSLEYFPSDNINMEVITGKMPDNDAERPEILLSERYLEPLGFQDAESAVGQTITVGIKQTARCYITPDDCTAEVSAIVAGIQAPSVLSIDGDLYINSAFDNQLYNLSIEGLPAETVATGNIVAVGNIDPAKIDSIRPAFRELGFEVMTIDDEVGLIRTFFNVVLIVLNIFGAIALLAASIGIINTLYMSVQERTREIGLMKAMGLSSGKIFFSFALEAILLGFWGSMIGIAVSMAVGYIGNNIAHQAFLSDFPTFQLVVFDPLRMGAITLIIMLIAFIAGTAPARKAAKKDPIEALRYE